MRPTKYKNEKGKKQFQQHLIRVVIFRRVRKTTSNANEMKWKIVNTKITEKEGMICFNIINKYITRRLAKERHEKMKETQRKTRERGRGREKRSMNYVKTEEKVKKASEQNVYG